MALAEGEHVETVRPGLKRVRVHEGEVDEAVAGTNRVGGRRFEPSAWTETPVPSRT